MEKYLPQNFLSVCVDSLKLLAHTDRMRIIEVLDIKGSLSVNDIAEKLELSPAAISGMLTQMRRMHLLDSTRKGHQVYYFISNPNCNIILDCIRAKYSKEQDK